MISRDNALLMARYNEWMNVRLFAVCAGLSESDLRQDRGAFFGSIQATLSHLAAADASFLSWFGSGGLVAGGRGADRFQAFAELREVRTRLDAELLGWAATLDAADLATPVTFTSSVDGRTRTLPKWALVVHMFNHQTHHRGQVTTLLSQSGHDVGSTDVSFVPGFECGGPGSQTPGI